MTFFTDLARNHGPSNIQGVAGTVPWVDIPSSWRSLIFQIIWHNNKSAKYARRGLLATETRQEAQVAFGLPVRSSHGNEALDPQPYSTRPAPMSALQQMWFNYSDDAKTDRCPAGCTPAYIEFTLSRGEGASRVVWDYMNNIYLVTDHYETFYEVTNAPAV